MTADDSSTRRKALQVNLDPTKYGVFAEIGAGQEVARWFFRVGGAAGTVAKTISAYDMALSDVLYGPTQRYVSRQRLEAMLDREYAQLIERLGGKRTDAAFFAFADTVAARSHSNPVNGRGWAGIRFQTRPHEEPSEIILHAHLFDGTPLHQYEALGILGVNLVHGALFHHTEPAALLGKLMDELSRARIEIDMIKLSGPAFAGVDNRLMSLELVEQGLTDAAMFTAAGEVVQPSEVLYKKPVLVERGSFRPATKLTLNLLERARAQFLIEAGVKGQEPVVLAEMTLRALSEKGEETVDHRDFLDRVEVLSALGIDALVSRFQPYYQLAEYLAASTDRMIGIGIGLPALLQLAEETQYADLAGGALESTGRLFKRSVKMYVYPMRDPASGTILSIDTAPGSRVWGHLRDLLVETGHLEAIRGYDEACLPIQTSDVRARIQRGDPSWEKMVPATVADIVKARGLFGHKAPAP